MLYARRIPGCRWILLYVIQSVPSGFAYGSVKLKEGDFLKVRSALNHLDEHFSQSSQAEPLRVALRTRAETLDKEARNLPDDQAIARLEEALTIWPRAPGLRDDIEKLKKSYRVLYVAVRQLPENLSPATAFTDAEHQALDLLFRRLVQVRFDEAACQHYEPDLVAELPRTDGLHQHLQLRRDAFWSDGERLTNADVRHTAQLLESTTTWRDLLEAPRFEGRPFTLNFTLKQGLLDPLAPLRFHVLPQKYRGQLLARADDPDFAKSALWATGLSSTWDANKKANARSPSFGPILVMTARKIKARSAKSAW